jgi:hypothetical protein
MSRKQYADLPHLIQQLLAAEIPVQLGVLHQYEEPQFDYLRYGVTGFGEHDPVWLDPVSGDGQYFSVTGHYGPWACSVGCLDELVRHHYDVWNRSESGYGQPQPLWLPHYLRLGLVAPVTRYVPATPEAKEG